LGEADLGFDGSDSYVAGKGEFAAAAEGEAVDGGDQDFGEAFDGREYELAALGRLLAGDRSHLRELVDVGAGHEGFLPAAGENDRFNVRIVAAYGEDFVDLLDSLRVQRVEDFRTVDGVVENAYAHFGFVI